MNITLDTVQRTPVWKRMGGFAEPVKTAAEAMELAGMTWEVEKQPIYFGPNQKSSRRFPKRHAMVRKDTREPLGLCADDYVPLQWREGFEWLETISPEFLAAQTMCGGRQGFIVARLTDRHRIEVLENIDPHELYVIIRTSHDCTRAVEVNITPMRLFCTNQLPLWFRGGHNVQRWSVRHISTMGDKLAEAKHVITGVDRYMAEYAGFVERLAAIELELSEAQEVLEKALPQRPKREEQIDEVLRLYKDDPLNTVGFPNTGWGLLNATSEYFDWQRQGGRITDESRFRSSLNGQSNKMINRVAARLLTGGY